MAALNRKTRATPTITDAFKDIEKLEADLWVGSG